MAGPTPERGSAPERATPTHRQVLVVLGGLLMGTSLSALDQTVVTTSIRTIADYFHNYALLAWVTTGYLATSTIGAPLYGKLSDLYGRRPCYLFAISVFAVGSLGCAFTTSIYQLTVLRSLQGVGAGGLVSLAFTILGDIVAPRQRGRYQGYFVATFTVANLLGPLLGGVLAGSASILGIAGWRWIFLINVPLSAATLLVVLRVLHDVRPRSSGVRVDWLGGLLLVVAITPLLVVAELGPSWGWLSDPALACYAVFVVGVAAYIGIEKRAGEWAITPLRIFANRSFVTGMLVTFLVGTVLVGVVGVVPQYFQVAQGDDPTTAGFRLVPAMLGVIVGTLVSGRLILYTGRYRPQALVGGTVTVVTLLALFFVTGPSSSWPFTVLLVLYGLGLGLFNQPLTLAAQNTLPPADMGVSTGGSTFFRQLGGTIGLAGLLSLFSAYSSSAIGGKVVASAGAPDYRAAVARTAATAGDPSARELATALAANDTAGATDVVVHVSAVIQAVPAIVARPFEAAFADGMGVVFVTASAISLLGLIGLLRWSAVPLRDAPGGGAPGPAAAEQGTNSASPRE